MLRTRPDLAYSIIKMSQFSSNPTNEHLQKALYITCYLASTKHLCIEFKGWNGMGFLAYSDTDWAGDVEIHHSTSSYAIFFADSIVSWLSWQQKMVTLSSTEAEYVSMSETTKQLSWIQSLCQEIHIMVPPIDLLCNNQDAMFLALNPAQEGCTKHIPIHYHYIRKCMQDSKLCLYYIHTSKQVANIFTKKLTWQCFKDIWSCLQLIPFPSSSCE